MLGALAIICVCLGLLDVVTGEIPGSVLFWLILAVLLGAAHFLVGRRRL